MNSSFHCQLVVITSSSAITEKLCCRVGQSFKSGRLYSADSIGLPSTTVT